MDNDISYFSHLSDDTLLQIALQLNITDLTNYCLYNLHFRNVCNNNWFWKEKFLLDFGPPEYDQVENWKSLYKNYGSVYGFGFNSFGQLGIDRKISGLTTLTPTKFLRFKVKTVSAGMDYTVAIDFVGDVWTFGINLDGQLGLGDRTHRFIPTKIPFDDFGLPDLKFKDIFAGWAHTVVLDFDNNVWTFGSNIYGQLGSGDAEGRIKPTKIPNFKAQSVVAGSTYTLALDFGYNVWAFGQNTFGQLGLGHTSNVPIPTKIINFKFKSVSAGYQHTVALDFDDNAWSFGQNKFGQLGLGDIHDRLRPTLIPSSEFDLPNFKFKAIVAGGTHTVALDFNGDVWTFGGNEHGQLGLGDTRERTIPTKIPFDRFGMPNIKVKAIFAGFDQTMVINFNDDVYAFGHNWYYQLGLEDRGDKLIPTKIPNFKAKYIALGGLHTLALSDYDFEENE
jgi:alpha-tubulin suppressor-like RCC1 family protein